MRDRLNGKQRKAIKEYESTCGFEFMHIDEINEKKMSFKDAWRFNVQWIRQVADDVANIHIDGCYVV